VDWSTIKYKISQVINFSDKETYLSKLIDNFEKQCQNQEHHPFKIVEIREKGFLVKIYGLFGFISFHHMPWEYNNFDSWKTVFPFLKGKVLFGKIFKFDKDPLKLIIDGKIPQFKKPELNEDQYYKGIVTKKTKYGVFVDIGYDFKWECGSSVGLLHKANFKDYETFEKIQPSKIVELIFWGFNDEEQLIFGKRPELKEWFTGKIEKLVDKVFPVKVIKSENERINYLVNEKYNATLSVNKILYPDNRNQIKVAIKNLNDGDIIHCKIIKANRIKRRLQLFWENLPEIESIISRTKEPEKSDLGIGSHKLIRNRIDSNIIEKLELIGKKVKVEVIKKTDNLGRRKTKYLVENKYNAKLSISNDSYKISKKDRKKIDKSLREGSILICEVINIENGVLRIKLNLTEEELIKVQSKQQTD